MLYTVLGCLGSIVGVHSSSTDAMQTVLKQVPLKPKHIRQLEHRLARAKAGDEVYQDYGDTQIIIAVSAT